MSENKETRFFELRAEADIDSDDLIFTGYASVLTPLIQSLTPVVFIMKSLTRELLLKL